MPSTAFTTARLLVRRWHPDEAADVHALYSQPDVVKWVGTGQPIDLEAARSWVDITQQNYASRGYGMFAICARETQAIYGYGGLSHPDQQPTPEAKYALHPSFWGRGIATEFLMGLVKYARGFGIASLTATAAAPNAASCRILENCGFHQVDRWMDEDGFYTVRYNLELTRTP